MYKRAISLLLVLTMLIAIPFAGVSATEEKTNLALSATASASSEHGSYPVSRINDGNTTNTSRWSSTQYTADKLPIWCQLNWEVAATFDTVVIYEWYNANGLRSGDYNLSISDDGEIFTTIYTGTELATSQEIKLEKAVTTKHLRLTFTSCREGVNDTPCVNEIQVYNYSGDAAMTGAVILGTDAVIDQENGTVTFTVDPGTSVHAITPEFTLAEGATISPTGPQSFASPVTYTVTAKDGVTTKQYVVSAVERKYTTDADLLDTGAEDVEAFGPVPSLNQYIYHRSELAAFLHFGMNTFTGKEWGNGLEDPSSFTLTEKIDADTYVRTLQEAGFTKIIVTAKHHDGFCIWSSEWTEHDIDSTNYPGDVLEDVSAACTKYDMDMGLYLSPWDENSVYYGYYDDNGNAADAETDVLDYNDYYAGQLQEILGNPKYGNNGRFVEVWMDGAKGSGADAQVYDFARFKSVIQSLQGKASGAEDDCLLFGCGNYQTVRWIGNESGVANEETWAIANASFNAAGERTGYSNGPATTYKGVTVGIGYKNGNIWVVPEVDARITSGWFWGENKKTPKTLEELRDMYMDSVGHASVLLLNVPLNNEGKLDDEIASRVTEWGQNVKESFHDNNLVTEAGVTVSASEVQSNDIRFKPSNVADEDDSTYWTANQGTQNASLIVDFGKEVTFDAITIEEEIYHGQRVEAFSVFYKTAEGEWIEYANGTTIGSKRVVLGRPVRATQLKLDFQGRIKNGAIATPVISHVGVYKASAGFEIGSAAPDGILEIDANASNFDNVSGWEAVRDLNATGASYLQGEVGDSMSVTFNGTKAWVMGLTTEATVSVSVDNGPEQTVSITDSVLFETGDLSDGQHTITLTVLSGSVQVDSLFVLDNGGKGLLDFEYDSYTVDEDMWFEVKVVRKGGTTGTINAIVQDNPGSAVQSSYVPTEGIAVSFADGETEKTVRVRTKRYTETTGTLSFNLDLVAAAGETGLVKGLNTPALISIIDAESYTDGYLQAIAVTQLPTKTEYTVGQNLDATGLVVEGTYPCFSQWEELTSGNGLGNGKVIKLDKPVTAGQLRMTFLSVLEGIADAPTISEIQIYNGDNTQNLALSATPSAMSVFNATYGADKINDGIISNSNRWSPHVSLVANGALPVWIQLNWDENITFDTIVVYERPMSIRADGWKVDVASVPTVDRVMDADSYEITPAGPITEAGTRTYTVVAKEDSSKTATFTVTAVAVENPVAQVNGIQYANLAEAISNADNAAVKLLADCGNVTVEKDLYLDLNGFDLSGVTVVDGATLYLLDSATDDYEGEYGTATVTGAVQNYVTYDDKTYLVVGADGVYSAHCYAVKLTHVTLDANHDALGYKAEFFGDQLAKAQVVSIGFNLWVNEERVVTKVLSGKTAASLRLKNIMAAGGGEMDIYGNAFVTFADDRNATCATYKTNMKTVLQTVNANWNSYSSVQQDAVEALCEKYADAVSGWGLTNICKEIEQ